MKLGAGHDSGAGAQWFGQLIERCAVGSPPILQFPNRKPIRVKLLSPILSGFESDNVADLAVSFLVLWFRSSGRSREIGIQKIEIESWTQVQHRRSGDSVSIPDTP